ncbi:MAG: hypothetical protein ABIK65_05355 [Candidatus Eisenbacteria bacterium]
MRQRLLVQVLFALLVPATHAAAVDFTWVGWGGQEWTNPAWGGYWTWDNQLMENGWGHSWMFWEDPAPHFPDITSSVLIPAGVYVDTEGGGAPYCGSLTVGEGATLDNQYANIVIGGPVLQNDGIIRHLAGGGSASGFEMSGPLSIDGTGEILLAPGRFFTWSPPAVLTIGAGQYIHGEGQFGSLPYGNYHGVQMTNHGHIQATSTTMPLDIFGTEVANDGSVEATGGALLRVWGEWDNTGGELLATLGGVVYLAIDPAHPARVRGGTLRTSGGGEIQTQGGGARVADLTLEGILHIRRYEGAHMAGTITNNGVIDQGAEGGAGWAPIQVDSALTFAGNGVLRMGAGNQTHMYNWPLSNDRVTNGPDHTIECYGGQFGTYPDYYGDRRIELVNEGTLRVFDSSYGARFYMTGSGFENRGDLILEPAASVNAELWGAFHQTAGRFVTNDGFVGHDSALVFSDGILTGSGYLQGSVSVGDSAVVNPGSEEGCGTLSIYGPLSFAGGATLVGQWSRDAQDLLRVNGLFSATGTLKVRVEAVGAGPLRPTDYVVLRADSHDDQATWVVELAAGWASSGLQWVGNDLVVRNLRRSNAVLFAPPVPARFHAAPNPFNPSTTIRFTNPEEGPVRLWVSDLRGRRVRTLLDGFERAGELEVAWDGRSDAGRPVGSGAYFCVLETGERRETIRLTIIR